MEEPKLGLAVWTANEASPFKTQQWKRGRSNDPLVMILSIVIGTRNRLELLTKCLNALMGKVSAACEIIVVDAGSTDGTIKYLDSLQGIRLIRDGEPIGQARSLNRVFRTIEAEYVCWLSDDNVVQAGALDEALAILEMDAEIGMVALKVQDVKGPHVSVPYIGGIWPTGILTCNQGVIRTRLLRDIGYFDEAYRDYGIDADITAKVLLAGYKVVYTKRVAVHHHRDHETLPGAIDNSQRAPRFNAAQELYRSKYAALLRYSLIDRIVSRSGRAIWRLIERLDNAGLGADGIFNYNKRDWYNVLHCRYVSKFDLLRNLRRPYYLVQRIRQYMLTTEK